MCAREYANPKVVASRAIAVADELAAQLEPPQTYGAHGCDDPGMQVPLPSQRPASVTVEPVHDCMPHARPGG